MRQTHQEVLFNLTGQSLVWDAPEGRPSSVESVKVYLRTQGDDGETEFEPTGTVETNPNTTIATISGAGQTDPTKILLTDATGVTTQRAYLLTSSLGEIEQPYIVAKDGNNVYARSPLMNSYAASASSTFKSTRITAPVDATWVADRNSVSPEDCTFSYYRVVWEYTVAGAKCRHESSLDLVRYSAQHTVKPGDVDGVAPGWLERVPTDYRREQGQWLIDQAFRMVRLDLLADHKAARWLRDLDVMNELVAYRTVRRATEIGALYGIVRPELVKLAQDLYTQRYTDLIREPKVPLASAQDGGSFAGVRQPILVR